MSGHTSNITHVYALHNIPDMSSNSSSQFIKTLRHVAYLTRVGETAAAARGETPIDCRSLGRVTCVLPSSWNVLRPHSRHAPAVRGRDLLRFCSRSDSPCPRVDGTPNGVNLEARRLSCGECLVPDASLLRAYFCREGQIPPPCLRRAVPSTSWKTPCPRATVAEADDDFDTSGTCSIK